MSDLGRLLKSLIFILLLFALASTAAFSRNANVNDDEAAIAEGPDDILLSSSDADISGLIDVDATDIEVTDIEVTDIEADATNSEFDDSLPSPVDAGQIGSSENIDAVADSEDKGKPNPVVMPPNSKPGGLSYGGWNEEWWQWALSMPIDDHPLYDTADSGEGQSGKVLFLGSSFVNEQAPSGEFVTDVDREIITSPGTKIFMPVFNVEVSTIEGYEGSEEEMQEQAASFLDFVADETSVEIDGVSVEDPKQYISPSPLFDIGPLPENNVLQDLGYYAPGGTEGNAAANGYYLMLPPLSVGEHTIHYTTPVVVPGGNPDGSDWIWIQDVNYTIIVEPDKGNSEDKANKEKGNEEKK